MTNPRSDEHRLTDEQARRRRQKNWAILAGLLALVLLFYLLTIMKLADNV